MRHSTQNFIFKQVHKSKIFSYRFNGTEHQTYTADGRIHTSSAVGTYSYNSPTRYNLGGFNLTQSANDYINSRAQRNISYNMFQDPVRLEENTILTFQYNLKNQRSFVEYKDYSKFKIYSEDAQVEVIETSKADGLYVKFITYIDGDAYTADFVYVKEMIFNTNVVNFEGYYYLHRDNQGTILAISNANGDLVESRYFDCWGQLKSGTINFIERGYTGHDHFQEVALIHMNGRLYDPFIRMFLQYDNYIQDASNPQNYNRFGYCLNNPLKYTDPSGELIDPITAFIIGASINAIFYTVHAISNNTFHVGELFFSIFVGGVSGIASYGIGNAFGSIGNVGWELSRAAAHGLSGTILNYITSNGNSNFGSDFLSGAVASLVGSGISAAFTNAGATQLVSLYVGSALSGGITAQLTGGDFLQGASRGLIIAALNHGLNHALNGGTSNQQQKQMQEKVIQELRDKIIKIAEKYIKLNPDIWSNPQKCNEFVLAVIKEAGYILKNHYLAGDFGNPDDIFSELPITENPKSGDIAAFKYAYTSGATGHSGILFIENGIKFLIYAAPLYDHNGTYINQHIRVTPLDYLKHPRTKFIYRTYNSNNN